MKIYVLWLRKNGALFRLYESEATRFRGNQPDEIDARLQSADVDRFVFVDFGLHQNLPERIADFNSGVGNACDDNLIAGRVWINSYAVGIVLINAVGVFDQNI